jgi:Protein of unknown function (DUF2950)
MKREMTSMNNRWVEHFSKRTRSAMIPFAILTMWATHGAYPGLAQQSSQPTFQSTAEASQSLYQAVQSNNEDAIANILGGPTELTTSRDAGQDKLDREMFVHKYQEMHRLGRESDGSVTLYIGAENWPFPIPLIEKNGAWRFDADGGLKEVLFRRIGENEFMALDVCHRLGGSGKQSSAKPKGADQADSPLASLAPRASGGSAGSDPVLIQGYYFHGLTAQPKTGKTADGFAFIAYPAEYRSSGVLTFVVTRTGVVYEKDLGPNTSALANAMTVFHKDATWRLAGE